MSIKDNTASTRSWFNRMQQYIPGIVAMCSLLIIILFTGDWWGLANWTAMAISVVVRRIMISQNLAALDLATSNANIRANEVVKVLLTLPTGNAITIKVRRGVVLHCLLTTPLPPSLQLYNSARVMGWIAFGIHIVSLGMTSLLNQLLAVTVLLISTVVAAQRVGDDDSCIGSHLHIQREDFVGSDFRAAAMARMELSSAEEETMRAWNLFPQKSNRDWWQKFRVCQASPNGRAFRNWDKVLATPFAATVPTRIAP